MSHTRVQNLSIVKRKDGYTYRGRFASSNVIPMYYEPWEPETRWQSRAELDLELAWDYWNGNLQGGQNEWAIRNDIAHLLSKRAGVKSLPVDEWDANEETHFYGYPRRIAESIIFPAARELYAHWKADKDGEYAIVDNGDAFTRKTITRRHSGVTIHRYSRPVYWNAVKTMGMAVQIALGEFSHEFRVVSRDVVERAERELGSVVGIQRVADRAFTAAPVLFEKEWQWCAARYPELLPRDDNDVDTASLDELECAAELYDTAVAAKSA